MLQVFVAISQKFLLRKEAWGYAKVIQKKLKNKKDTKVSEISKTMGTQMFAWKKEKEEMNKIAPIL